ncbi:hypothetical protein ACTFAO_07455 [Sphingobacterium spiritivorum]|uniref:hypothetical protein n=1 Tax=Sphingobacterium spiritivorum TaxID=258 RepID=UPI003F774072
MMKSFPNRSILNPGGLSEFYFIPFSAISKIPAMYNGALVQSFDFKPGAKFLKGYASSESLKFSEKASKSDNGTFYDQELQGTYPGDSAEAQTLFAEMEAIGNQFFIVFSDMLGKQRLAGYGGNLEFVSQFDSENKRYSFSFSGNTLERAPLYPFPVLL